MLHLITFGGLRLDSDGVTTTSHLRRSWLAMLAVVAAAGERGIPRDRFVAVFWPESDEERARQSARQALYSLRQGLGREVVRTRGPTLCLDAAAISTDVSAFKAAIAAGDRARAVTLSALPFLDGVSLPGMPAFQRWAEEERSRIEGLRVTALLALASEATRAGRSDEAVEYWRELVESDQLNGRHAVGYLKALAARGDRAAALAFARKHETVIRRELEVDADPDVRRLEAELRAMPSAIAPHATHAPQTATRSEPSRDSDPGAAVEPLVGPTAAAAPAPRRWRPRARRTAVVGVIALGVALLLQARRGTVQDDEPPVFAVGMIREVNVPDSARAERVFTDMLATNLARIQGLHVLANSRVLQVLRAATDTAVAYADAARRAGASDLFEGQLLQRSTGLALELRRVDLRTGMVRDAITVTADDRVALVDSVTAEMARRLRLASPASSVAAATTNSPVAYRLYEEGLRAYYRDDYATARQLMRAALVEESTFAMAAYHEALLAALVDDHTPDGRRAFAARATALRLAQRAPDRERLMITANMLVDDSDPAALAFAELLAVQYPEDPGSHLTLGRTRHARGDWRGAVAAFERAIALDSSAGLPDGKCRVCEHVGALVMTYLWADSLDAAARTAERYLRFRKDAVAPAYWLTMISARRGDSAATYDWYRRVLVTGGGGRTWKLNLDAHLELYDEVERLLPQFPESASPADQANARWYYLIALRNQGRLRDADDFSRTGRLPSGSGRLREGGPEPYTAALLALARGDGRVVARLFESATLPDPSSWSRASIARHRAWYGTLEGMGRAAMGDTGRLRALADSVELWGSRSGYGRDRRAHHYLRGLLHVAAHRDEEAVREFREAIHSPSLGFTRVNYELGRTLLRLGRPREAVAAAQPALRGELDASNLYVTRTELHELLADAFDRAGMSDSATAHFRAVVRAWDRADPEFGERRDRAARRLQTLSRIAYPPARQRSHAGPEAGTSLTY